jgi:GDP-D-mannose dehydratase
LFRPVDVPVFLGDASLLRSTTGWAPSIPFAVTLADMFEYWRSRPAAAV